MDRRTLSKSVIRLLSVVIALGLLSVPSFAGTRHHGGRHSGGSRAGVRARGGHASRASRVRSHRTVRGRHVPVSHVSRLRHKHSFLESWTSPTFADSTAGDTIDGEDLTVRRAAVQALGPYNGTIVVADPMTGRILSMVNQKLALKSGFQPCSTIKLVAALAGLSEGAISKANLQPVGSGRWHMNLTYALARSNNYYFATVGNRLGFETVSRYARLFGLGEKAGHNISGEETGTLPDAPPRVGGTGMMTSFGEGINQTPLQLAALVSAIANGGTLYYLQYPKSQDEANAFTPKIKRKLEIEQWIPEIKPGMMGAVEFGTARRANYSPNEPIFGKTGTCTDLRSPTHLGWFGSFNEVGNRKLVVVVLLTGGRPINGPVASGVAGQVYKNLSSQNYFGQQVAGIPVSLVATQSCCR